ncbi:tyrosine-type recombinase/integrase [Gimesia sp.]|uniref:tyrosine-type recombinase/integrase n=1 Tax=Gimesia sp. TaxID=2024833 RepID=UPI0032EEAB97
MPKPRQNEIHDCKYFRWKILQRNEIYYADGRSNTQNLGRHSLGTRDRDEALENLDQLDLIKAIDLGLADRTLLEQHTSLLTIAEGRAVYEEHCKRPVISGGPRPATRKRYRAVLDKFDEFCKAKGKNYWNELNRRVMDEYATWLHEKQDYAYQTLYLELTTLKQIHKYLIEDNRLPAELRFQYPIQKETDSSTYCWTKQEVEAMLKLCSKKKLFWLRHVLIGLVTTGMRISELAGLMWKDIDLQRQIILLADESRRRDAATKNRRTTKSGKSRSFPIHPDLMDVLIAIDKHQDGLVFHGPLGGKIKPDTIRNILIREVLEPLSETFPAEPGKARFQDGRLHSFRHYFCSVCANNGTPERVLMNWLGHSSSRMVKRYYHLHDEESLKQMQKITFV